MLNYKLHISTLRSLLDDASKGCILLGGILLNATIVFYHDIVNDETKQTFLKKKRYGIIINYLAKQTPREHLLSCKI